MNKLKTLLANLTSKARMRPDSPMTVEQIMERLTAHNNAPKELIKEVKTSDNKR